MSSRVKSNKKGVSIIIAYVLIIAIAMAMGAIVFAWLKIKVPKDSLECPDESSLFIKKMEYICDSTDDILNLTLRNNGKFSLAGYYIYATNKSEQELANIDLSQYLNEDYGGFKLNAGVKFHSMGENTLIPGNEINNLFDSFNTTTGRLYSIEIIPMRFETFENENDLVICSDSRITKKLSCS